MTPPRRRWLTFSLRTFFVAATLICCWLGYLLNWIRERQQILNCHWVMQPYKWNTLSEEIEYSAAPGALGIFGEKGYPCLIYRTPDIDDKTLGKLFGAGDDI